MPKSPYRSIVVEYSNLFLMGSKEGMSKPHQKLVKLAAKAERCITRKEAQKLIKKAEKAHSKLIG